MKKEKAPKTQVKTPKAVHMANVYRYFFLPILVLVALFWRSKTLLVMGAGFIVFSLYTLIGTKLRWNTIRLSTALKFPLAFGILGLIMVIYHLFYL